MTDLPRSAIVGTDFNRRFVIRQIEIAGRSERRFVAAEWRDAIVRVARGSLELEGVDGQRWSFATGSLICLEGLALLTLRNRCREPLVLVAVSRAGWPIAQSSRGDEATDD
jgi:hypothetical protein